MDTAAEPLRTGLLALQRYRAGWSTGSWAPFVELLSPGFTLCAPIGDLRGRAATRAEVVSHFKAMRLLGVRLQLGEPLRVASSDRNVTFELEVTGALYGLPYRNTIAISLDVEAGLVTALREYFGELDREILARALK